MRRRLLTGIIGAVMTAGVTAAAGYAVGTRTHEVRWFQYLRPCEQGVVMVLESKLANDDGKRKKSLDQDDFRGHWNAYILNAVCRPQGL